MPAETFLDIRRRLLLDCCGFVRASEQEHGFKISILPSIHDLAAVRFTEPMVDFLGASKTGAGRYRATEGLAIQET